MENLGKVGETNIAQRWCKTGLKVFVVLLFSFY